MLKQYILNTNAVADNVFLDKYVKIVSKPYLGTKPSHNHHIIPKSYYRHNNLEVDNTASNLVRLTVKNHILAHYYLAKCSKQSYFKLSNIWSVCYMLRLNKNISLAQLDDYIEIVDFTNLGKNNSMHVPSIRAKHDNKIRTQDVRQQISNTNKQNVENGILFNEQHRQKLKEAVKTRTSKSGANISRSGYVGGVTGLKMMYDKQGKRRYVAKDKVDELIQQGYTLPINLKKWDSDNIPKTNQKHTYKRHISKEELRKKLSEAHKGQVPINKGKPMSEKSKKLISEKLAGAKWLNNGLVEKPVKQQDIETYLKEGFVYGRIKKRKRK